jgi:DNA-binding CsgD family transcriptional regulator
MRATHTRSSTRRDGLPVKLPAQDAYRLLVHLTFADSDGALTQVVGRGLVRVLPQAGKAVNRHSPDVETLVLDVCLADHVASSPAEGATSPAGAGAVGAQLPAAPAQPGAAPDTVVAMLQALSPRERDVIGHIARGYTHHQTARRLGVSKHTVDTYVKRVRAKLNLGNKAELTCLALRGLSLDPPV